MLSKTFSFPTHELQIQALIFAEKLDVTFSGAITEDVNLADVFKELSEFGGTVSTICLNVSGVNRINSCGVREWLLFMERLQAKYALEFSFANETLIEQAAITPNILGKDGTPVRRFDAPFFCAKCNQRRMIKFESSSVQFLGDQPSLPQPQTCEKCKGNLEFDAIEDEYLSFIKHHISNPA